VTYKESYVQKLSFLTFREIFISFYRNLSTVQLTLQLALLSTQAVADSLSFANLPIEFK